MLEQIIRVMLSDFLAYFDVVNDLYSQGLTAGSSGPRRGTILAAGGTSPSIQISETTPTTLRAVVRAQ